MDKSTINQQSNDKQTISNKIIKNIINNSTTTNKKNHLKNSTTSASSASINSDFEIINNQHIDLKSKYILMNAVKDYINSDQKQMYDVYNYIFNNHFIQQLSVQQLNVQDSTGRTPISYIVSNGQIDLLEILLQTDRSSNKINVNLPDNEGNTPAHFAAQAGQVECLNFLISRCPNIEIDARNHLGFTPLMKAALQGRNKCAKLLLFAGASPSLRDTGRGLTAEQWARYCGRSICAEMIEKFTKHRLIARTSPNGAGGCWASEPDIPGANRILMGKVNMVMSPSPSTTCSSDTHQNNTTVTSTSNCTRNQHNNSNSIKSKIKRVFRPNNSIPSNSNRSRTSNNNNDGSIDSVTTNSSRLITQLTTAALCASTPVLPTCGVGIASPSKVKKQLTVPKLEITLVNNNGELDRTTNITNGYTTKTQGSIIEQVNQQKSIYATTASTSNKTKKKK